MIIFLSGVVGTRPDELKMSIGVAYIGWENLGLMCPEVCFPLSPWIISYFFPISGLCLCLNISMLFGDLARVQMFEKI